MKKIYNKPTLYSINLSTAESLMTGSKLTISDEVLDGSDALSNEESQNDIWGNGGSIW